jgi:hypothetical protein
MSMATDLLSSICDEIDARLRELAPALAEYEQLLAAAQALDSRAAQVPQTQTAAAAPLPVARIASPTTRRRTAGATRTRSTPSTAAAKTRARRAPSRKRSEVEETILGILEHGSHTVAELGVVTALSAAKINASLRKLAAQSAIARTAREGKAAWALAQPPSV